MTRRRGTKPETSERAGDRRRSHPLSRHATSSHDPDRSHPYGDVTNQHTRSGSTRYLQRTFGNRALSRLHESGMLPSRYEGADPNGPAEREADRIANRIARGGGTATDRGRSPAKPSVTTERSPSRTACSTAIRSSGEAPSVDPWTAIRGGGMPLPPTLRREFEGRFGTDFADVRVHTGARADAAATSIGARAYTIGSDVAFAAGNYDPGTPDGRVLLAHELTHVLQQRRGAIPAVQRDVDTSYRIERVAHEENPYGWRWVPPDFGGAVGPVEDLYAAFLLLERFHEGLDGFVRSTIEFPDGVETRIREALEEVRESKAYVWTEYTHVASVTDDDVPIDETIAVRLADTTSSIVRAYGSIGRVRNGTLEELRTVRRGDDLERNVRKLRTALNDAFMAGETGDSMATLAEGVAKADDLLSAVESAMARVRLAEELLDRPLVDQSFQTLETYVEVSAGFLSDVNDVMTAGRAVVRLLDSSAVSGVEEGIQNLEAGMTLATMAVDARTGTLHPYGVYWNEYVVPMTEAALEGVRHLNREYRSRGRDLAAIDFRGRRDRRPDEPPRIPEGLAETEAFPGGQPVFDYMWRLVNDQEGVADAATKRFFETHRDVINAGLPGDARLSERDVQVMNLRTPAALRRHGPIVWAMLYGNLPMDQ